MFLNVFTAENMHSSLSYCCYIKLLTYSPSSESQVTDTFKLSFSPSVEFQRYTRGLNTDACDFNIKSLLCVFNSKYIGEYVPQVCLDLEWRTRLGTL